MEALVRILLDRMNVFVQMHFLELTARYVAKQRTFLCFLNRAFRH